MVGAIDSPPDKPYKMDLDSLPTLNPATGMTAHTPVTEQYNYETFVGGMDDLPAIRQDVAGPNALQGSTAPTFSVWARTMSDRLHRPSTMDSWGTFSLRWRHLPM